MNLTTIGFWGAYPEYDEPTSGYLLQTKETNILLECGSGILTKLYEFIDPNDLDAVIITHEHMDHCADLMSLYYSVMIQSRLGKRDKPLSVYIPKYMKMLDKYKGEDHLNLYHYDEKSHYDYMGVALNFSKNIHPVEAYAVNFKTDSKKITFTGDTELYENLIDFTAGSDLLISECSLYDTGENSVTGHMSAYEAADLAKMSHSKELLLTHLPHFGDHEDLILNASRNFSGDIYLAGYGLSFEL
ncbi:MAG TPA: MBL fold metallo-hydrolase [Thermotogota bacterium]|nr:MBL fold metallo-hydrolase [Thermotogota bacterium]